mgnify:FL=1
MKFNLDIRYPKNGDADLVYRQMKSALTAYDMDILEHRTTEMLYVPKDSELVQKLMEVYREEPGKIQNLKQSEAALTLRCSKIWLLSDRCFREIRTWHTSRMSRCP